MSTPQLTRNQSLVFQALEKAEGPLSAYTILDKLRDSGFRAPLQVYRALEKLLEFGLVHRLESLNAFVVCSHLQHDCCHHGTVAFAICNRCGQVQEFHDHSIDHRLQDWSKARGFKAEKTTIEIRGVCENCLA
ncbi:Fur family transcriptional regulator [Allorhizobium taibaishanense]|uniref:Ferric uptake regulation protein n=1 Tax=Allorhizobium taibaishanense TaxID=887144 RepID=A0A1Q9A1H3_9HYPH|nr:Fur family transcriptional regulator [Allorhizobium taibaishanense]MBB4008007.1 Fur family zinc uptake transcriptional regulator [Allorhizobium taibaishanense]OLP48317.1 Fur family transcriptional regulator [Allorhizobium taibaishanense]